MSEQWLGPGEMARRLGVTPKALRVYERDVLVTAARTEAGWRVAPCQGASRSTHTPIHRRPLPAV
jgi:hypothetical protein